MSDKFASTTSLLSSHASTLAEPKKSGLRSFLSSQKSKSAKKEEMSASKTHQEEAAWRDSKFADMATKNGWSAPTPTRPSF